MVTAVGILQPCYLPWLGYFEQIASVDHFIFFDEVQYTRQDWRNRNRIKTANGSVWLTVPVRRSPLSTPIHHIEIEYTHAWQRRHLRSIEQSYSKCPHFRPFFDDLTVELGRSPTRLVDLDCALIDLICRYLEIGTPTSRSSQTPLPTDSDGVRDRNQRLIELCQQRGADLFYEGASGRDYLDVERFRRAGIEVVFQDYEHPTYAQAFGRFLGYQSAIDLVMNTGPEAPAILRSSPIPERMRRARRCSSSP